MSFYVTLPSNVSIEFFPTNTTTNYTTLLKTPLRLNTEYEVGLAEIIYNQSWKVNLGKVFINDRNIITEKKLYAVDGENYETLVKRINAMLNSYTISKEYERRKTIFHEKYLSDEKKEFLEHIEAGLKILLPNIKNKIKNQIVVDDILKTIEMPRKSLSNERIHFLLPDNISLKFEGRILEILNLEEGYLNSLSHSKKIIRKNIESINSLFIYTDIIDFQFVGDEMAPLIRNVVVMNEYTHSVCRIYEAPHYIPVNKSEIYTINIDIRDDTGEKIQFIEGRVIIKLHFRPKEKKNGFQ